MGIAERREREREALRTRIVEAARDIVSEEGLDALSMRAIAERIEYSPATIYLYFRDKDALLRTVIEAGFERMGEYQREALGELGPEASAAEEYRALGRGYVRFALENTAYFRVMFELPTVAQVECVECGDGVPMTGEHSWQFVVSTVRRAVDGGELRMPDPARGALVGWGMIHGLTSLYLSGHLAGQVGTPGELLELIEEAMAMLRSGWLPRASEDGQGGGDDGVPG